jgi:uncharacterized membrane protein
MDWKRWFRHVFATRGELRRAFSEQDLDAIERAVDESELSHSGEIRVAVEGALEPGEVWHGKTPRERALEIFAALGVWDTEANNGVLIYVLLADRDVEIVADRGFNGRVEDVGKIIARHFPQLPGQRDEDELPNRPRLL